MGMYGKCPTCGKLTKMEGDFCKAHTPKTEREHGTFRRQVEPASEGACMFCSGPATLRFTGDDSVRVCTQCLDF